MRIDRGDLVGKQFPGLGDLWEARISRHIQELVQRLWAVANEAMHRFMC
jgi:hypothetical protein